MEHSRILKNFNHDIWKAMPNREKIMSVIKQNNKLKEQYNIET